MPKFNLYDYQKISGDEHIEKRLRKIHVTEQNEINEKQLEKGRVKESSQLIEKLLEKTRPGEASVITEKRLNDVKAGFGIKNRNSAAYKGDMNKLEEKRLLNDPVEDEKYSDTSTTPKAFRWWDTKTNDGFKLAKNKKQTKTAGIFDEDTELGGDESEDIYEAVDAYNIEEGLENENFPIEETGELPLFEQQEYTVDNSGGTSFERDAVKVNAKRGPDGMKETVRPQDIVDFIRGELFE